MIKETSWKYVLTHPDRWGEAYRYFTATKPRFGAGDRPDPRDLDAKIPLGALVAKLPESVELDIKAEKIGWRAAKQTKNACTSYSKGGGVEVVNTMEHNEPIYIDKEVLWGHQEDSGASRDEGDFVQNAEYQFHHNPQGYPQTKYRRLRRNENTVNGVKRWLAKQETVRTGLYWKWCLEDRAMNMKVMQDTGFFVAGDGEIRGGHACFFAGYRNDKVNPTTGEVGAFKMRESELMKWGDNPPGVLWVSYSDFARLFSKYVSQDAIDK